MTVLYLNGLSMLTPLGADLDRVKTAIDAGINSYQLCTFFGDEGFSTRFSPVPDDALKMLTLPSMLPGMTVLTDLCPAKVPVFYCSHRPMPPKSYVIKAQ